jgi:[acyl-carrier-protein] S-malonyltransferase
MAQLGFVRLLECGPGKVLAPLARRIDASVSGTALVDRASIETAIANISTGA